MTCATGKVKWRASLIENWLDEAERSTWFLFETAHRSEG
jgi:hypothetical protein